MEKKSSFTTYDINICTYIYIYMCTVLVTTHFMKGDDIHTYVSRISYVH